MGEISTKAWVYCLLAFIVMVGIQTTRDLRGE